MPSLRKSLSKALSMPLACTLALSGIVSGIGAGTALANSYTVPKLLITEVTPDSKQVDFTTGTPDAFEFVELYNNTSSTINLKNYRIIYETPTVYNWTITTDKYIAPHSTFVVWIKSDASATLAQFNQNYGTSLTSSQVFEVSAGGMANTADRTLSIAASDNVKISTVSYTVDDVAENIGIPYLYPTDGTNEMRKLTTDSSKASPGSVFAGQVPPTTWDDVDPATPTGVTAKPGTGQVTLSWNANTESDLAFYRVYVDGVHYHTYRKETRSAVITGLNAEQDYTFEVTAVDTSNNASVKKAVVSAPLTYPLTQENVVSTTYSNYSEYNEFFSSAANGPIVPGLKQHLVPQGMTYVAAKNWYLVSYYSEYDGETSMLAAIDASTNKLVKSMTLNNKGGTPFTGHAGGLAATESDLWVTNGSSLSRIPLTDIYNVPSQGKVYFKDSIASPVKASFATYANNKLWIGEFYEPTSYDTDDSHYQTTRTGTMHHAWMVGYDLDPTTHQLKSGAETDANGVVTPNYVLSLPDKTQGATVLPDGRIVLSTSYGRSNDSNIYVYQNVLNEAPHYQSSYNGGTLDSWYLDHDSCLDAITSPPMAEGLTTRNGYVYALFESGALKYSDAYCPLDNIMQLTL